MARAPFQVLVCPYRIGAGGAIQYALFERPPSTGGYWQPIAGGEDAETPLAAARREAAEEGGIEPGERFFALSMSMLPVVDVAGFRWGPDVLVIPNYAFAVAVERSRLRVSEEHVRFDWFSYADAVQRVRWDDNRHALWELNHRLTGGAS